jgi:hypothetical protein
MASVTDLPIRESTSPRTSAGAENIAVVLPSMWQCVRIGFGLMVGAWVAALILALPTAVIVGRLYLVAWLSMMHGLFGR